MEEQERASKVSPEIYVYATNKNFVNIYDALRIEKVKIEIAGYDPASNRQTGHASAWLDKDDARLLSHLMCNRLFHGVTGGKWEMYGGSQREDGSIESRTLTIEWDEGDGGRFARFPYRLTIANGPGKKTNTGGVSPAGEPTARLSMRLPELDAIKMMLALGDYIRAYDTAHHHRLVAQRVRDLRDKLAERASRYEAPTPLQEQPSQQRPSTERPAAAAAAARPALKAMPGGNRGASRIDRLDSARVG
jgi:hypothetical protein